MNPYRLAGLGALAVVVAFFAVLFASPLHSPTLLRVGVMLIGCVAGA